MGLSKLTYFLFPILFVSCGTNILISPLGCKTDGKISKKIINPDFVVEKSVWAPFGSWNRETVKIGEILRENNIKCKNLAKINISTTSSWQDVLRSFIPFIATRTVQIRGVYNYRPDLLTTDGLKVASSHDE